MSIWTEINSWSRFLSTQPKDDLSVTIEPIFYLHIWTACNNPLEYIYNWSRQLPDNMENVNEQDKVMCLQVVRFILSRCNNISYKLTRSIINDFRRLLDMPIRNIRYDLNKYPTLWYSRTNQEEISVRSSNSTERKSHKQEISDRSSNSTERKSHKEEISVRSSNSTERKSHKQEMPKAKVSNRKEPNTKEPNTKEPNRKETNTKEPNRKESNAKKLSTKLSPQLYKEPSKEELSTQLSSKLIEILSRLESNIESVDNVSEDLSNPVLNNTLNKVLSSTAQNTESITQPIIESVVGDLAKQTYSPESLPEPLSKRLSSRELTDPLHEPLQQSQQQLQQPLTETSRSGLFDTNTIVGFVIRDIVGIPQPLLGLVFSASIALKMLVNQYFSNNSRWLEIISGLTTRIDLEFQGSLDSRYNWDLFRITTWMTENLKSEPTYEDSDMLSAILGELIYLAREQHNSLRGTPGYRTPEQIKMAAERVGYNYSDKIVADSTENHTLGADIAGYLNHNDGTALKFENKVIEKPKKKKTGFGKMVINMMSPRKRGDKVKPSEKSKKKKKSNLRKKGRQQSVSEDCHLNFNESEKYEVVMSDLSSPTITQEVNIKIEKELGGVKSDEIDQVDEKTVTFRNNISIVNPLVSKTSYQENNNDDDLIVHVGSNTVSNEESDIVNERSGIVNEGSDIINEGSGIVNDETEIINEGSGIINEGSGIVNEESDIINEVSSIINEGSNDETEIINEDSNLASDSNKDLNHLLNDTSEDEVKSSVSEPIISLQSTRSGRYELTIPIFHLKKELVPLAEIPKGLPVIQSQTEPKKKSRKSYTKKLSWINGKKKVSKTKIDNVDK